MTLERDLIDTAIAPMSEPDPSPEHQICEGSASAARSENLGPVSEAPVHSTVIFLQGGQSSPLRDGTALLRSWSNPKKCRL
jgi:hypothetical protein